ncbi:MAG: alpha/beta fold hydrolase [Chloroflexota bacterium]|nr:alpha/beta fold hydrolase [Chloroflexota bacterium]
MRPLFVLVHSPLVGPFTWSFIADDLRGRGYHVLVPELANPTEPPFWTHHTDSVARSLAAEDAPLVLVGHSGAGPLLPAIARATARPVAAYIFVGAGLPADSESRMGTGSFASYLRDLYARNERFPNWSEEDLRDILPHSAVRTRLIADLRPQPLTFWGERLPVIDSYPDAPGAYLQFTSTYDDAAKQARRLGWPYRHLQGGHFHMLVDPIAVTEALVELTHQMRVKPMS